MPEYEVELSDGRIVEVEADRPPTLDELFPAIQNWKPPGALGGAQAKGAGVPEQAAPAPPRALAVPPINGDAPTLPPFAPTQTTPEQEYDPIRQLHEPLVRLPTVTGRELELTRIPELVAGAAFRSPLAVNIARQTEKTSAAVLAGLQQATVGATEFFLSPVGIATLGAGALPKLAQKGVAGYFVYQMAKQSPEMVKELAEAWYANDPERLSNAAASLGLNTAFIAGGAKAIASRATAPATPKPRSELFGPENRPPPIEKESVPVKTALPAESEVTTTSGQAGVKPPPVEEAKPAGAQAGVKEPWQMTKNEAFQERQRLEALHDDVLENSGTGRAKQFETENPLVSGNWPDAHYLEVGKAVREGKPVLPEVLADYPDLTPKPQPPAKPAAKEAVAPVAKIETSDPRLMSDEQLASETSNLNAAAKPFWDQLDAMGESAYAGRDARPIPEAQTLLDRIKPFSERKESLQRESQRRATELQNKAMYEAREKRVAAAPVFQKANGWEIIKDGVDYVLRHPQSREDVYRGKLSRVREVAKESRPESEQAVAPVAEAKMEVAKVELMKWLREEGLTDENAKAVIGGTMTAKEAVAQNMKAIRPAYDPQSGPTATGQGHAEAVQMGFEMAVARIEKIVEDSNSSQRRLAKTERPLEIDTDPALPPGYSIDPPTHSGAKTWNVYREAVPGGTAMNLGLDYYGGFGVNLSKAEAVKLAWADFNRRQGRKQQAAAALPEPARTTAGEGRELARTIGSSDSFERARKGDESAFEELDSQFREIYPEPEELGRVKPDPNQVRTAAAFKSLFDKSFAARDFDSVVDAIKATSDVSIWKPYLKELFAAQAKDPTAAAKAEWFRHVFNGTRPTDAVPRPTPRPTAPRRPPPPVTPTPRPTADTPPPPRPPPTPPAPPHQRIAVEPITGGGAKSPFKIIEDFSSAIGKAIRVRRMKKNTLGTYSPGSTLTAERFAGDLDTAAHELAGHWTDDLHGIGKPWVRPRTRSPYDSELAKFWIHGSVTPTSTLRYRRAEGIAEFIRAYVVNPTAAKAEAPNFSAYFERTLPAEALKAINDFGKDVRTWAGEDPLVRAGLNLRMEPPSIRERLWKGLRGRGFGFQINPIDRLRLWFDDSYHYAVKADKLVQELRGGTRLPMDDFELQARLLSTHDSRMADEFKNGLTPLRPGQRLNAQGKLDVVRLTDPVTREPMTMKWLVGAFETTSKADFQRDMRDASAFMVAQRTLEKGVSLGRESNISGIGAGIMTDVQAARELLNRVAQDPARQARLTESARRYRLWADQNIDMLVESGRLSREQAREIRDRNEQYVDMHRLSEEFELSNRQTRGGKIGTTRDVIKRFRGSTLELDNVYSNLLDQTEAIQKEAFRNVTLRTFTDGLTQVRELHGPNLIDFDQFGSRAKSADRNTITVFKDGKAEYWKFDPDIYESLKGLGELGTHAFIDLAALPSTFARYMITHGPQFITRNIARDTFERTVQSRSGSLPWDILAGYSKADLSRYEVFGGGQFGNYIIDRHIWNRELKRTMNELVKDPNTILLSPLKLKSAWESLSQKSEKLGRIAEFRRAFERGKREFGYDDYNAALYAAGQARGLLDFAKAGTVMRVINRLVPFSNAAMRGLGRSYTGLKENPARYGMRWGLSVVVPTIAIMLWNRSDEETWKEYLQLPAYRRDFFWNLKMGPYWLTIPKPHLLGVLAGGVERAIIRASGDKRATEGFGGSLASSASPIRDPVEGTGPLKTFLELEFNRDTFRDRDIVPVWERDLKLELRKGTEHASGLGKGIARAINTTGLSLDPRQADYVLQSYGGLGQIATSIPRLSVGQTALKATGYVADTAGSAARDVQWVLDWARENNELSDKRIKRIQDLRKAALSEKDPAKRDIKNRELRRAATALRDTLDK